MFKSEAFDFPFVEELPKREKSRWRKLADHFDSVRNISEAKGILVPVKLAADLAGVSRQRIHQLFEADILERVELHGHPFVTEKSFLAWASSERKNGRPLKEPSFGALVKMSVQHGQDAVE